MEPRSVTVAAGVLRAEPESVSWNGARLDLGDRARSGSIVLWHLAAGPDEIVRYGQLIDASRLARQTVEQSVQALSRAVGAGTSHALEVDAIDGGCCRLVTEPVPSAAEPPRPDLTRMVLTIRAGRLSDRLELDPGGSVTWNHARIPFRVDSNPRLLWSLAASAGRCVPRALLAARSGVPERELARRAVGLRNTLARRGARSLEIRTVRRRGLMLVASSGRLIDLSWEP